MPENHQSIRKKIPMKKRFKQTILLACGLLSFSLLADNVPYATKAPVIDGDPSDIAWTSAEWVDINHLVLGSQPDENDFKGRYKLVWNKDHLYLLAEITDDVLRDSHADPLLTYWDDDTLEIFIDEDASGGDHLYNYNAFAYHIALDNQAVDIGPFHSDADQQAGKRNIRVFPEHIQAQWKRGNEQPHPVYWEVKLAVYGDDFQDSYSAGQKAATPVKLEAGKTLGFMVAYCDSDNGLTREHFMGDIDIEPVDGDRNRGYIDASVFGTIHLVD